MTFFARRRERARLLREALDLSVSDRVLQLRDPIWFWEQVARVPLVCWFAWRLVPVFHVGNRVVVLGAGADGSDLHVSVVGHNGPHGVKVIPAEEGRRC